MMVDTSVTYGRKGEGRAPRVDTRPLYIAPGREVRVALDGPALSIAREERPLQLFPLQRIGRVYTGIDAEWTSTALLACAERGIGVLFVDEQGEIRARLLGRPGVHDSMRSRLLDFLVRPEALGMYRHWLGVMTRRAAWWAGGKLKTPRAEREPGRCRRWVNRSAAVYAGEEGEELSRQWLRAAAYGWMQAHLVELGFGSGNELGQSGEPVLARDLTEVLSWYLEPARVGWLRRRYLAARRKHEPAHPPAHKDLIRLFESRACNTAARGREITGSLHRWLIREC